MRIEHFAHGVVGTVTTYWPNVVGVALPPAVTVIVPPAEPGDAVAFAGLTTTGVPALTVTPVAPTGSVVGAVPTSGAVAVPTPTIVPVAVEAPRTEEVTATPFNVTPTDGGATVTVPSAGPNEAGWPAAGGFAVSVMP